MPLARAQAAVLADLVARVPEDRTWCLFGSVDSVLRGVDADPSDVDLLATEVAAGAIRDAFADAFVGTRAVDTSQIDEYRVRGEEVEVIYSVDAAPDQEPLVDLETVALERVAPEEVARVAVDGAPTPERGVPTLPPGELLAAYRDLGKHETAAELAERLSVASD